MGNATAAPGCFGPVRQLGYVVADLDRAVRAWSTQFGVGPWMRFRNVSLLSTFRGQPSTPLIDLALGYRGDVQIELIQQRNDAPSPYRAFIDAGREGLHHIAFLSERVEEDLQRAHAQGLELACDIRMPSGRYVYLQSPELGEQMYIELLEATPQMLGMFAEGVAAAARWDGSGEPVVIDFAAMAQG
ncbi:MAG TPA: VOC family protein [Solimonas sp.]|nr:VOC family protein [Solimonas sp.]